MNLVFITAAIAAVFLSTVTASQEKCKLDVVFSLDVSSTLNKEQFDRSKAFVADVHKKLAHTENSVKIGLMAFGDTAAQSLVTLQQGTSAIITEREIGPVVQKGARPTLMKSLQMVQTFFKEENGHRADVGKTVVIFIAGEPSNIIGCLKGANQVRQTGVKLIPVALVPKDDEGKPESLVKERDFTNFLSTIAGNAEDVHVVNINSDKLDEYAAYIAGVICPSQSAPKPVEQPKLKVAETPVEASTTAPVEPVEQHHKLPVHEYRAAGETIIDEMVEEVNPAVSRVQRSTTTKQPTLKADPDRHVERLPPIPNSQPVYGSHHEAVPQHSRSALPPKPQVHHESKPHHGGAQPQPHHNADHGPRKLAEPRHTPIDDLPFMPLNIVTRPTKATTSTTTTTTTTMSPQDMKAVAFCQEILSDAEVMTDQFFGNPEDCTSFYQCSLETGVLTAKLFSCQPGMFWKEQLKQCMPGVACKDRCEEPAVAKRGVWADPNNCRRWFQCANSISYPACCPSGTAYHEPLGTCVSDETCEDECETGTTPNSEEEQGPTTAEPRFDANGCYDRWGGLKRPNRRNPTKYLVHIGKNHFVPVNCPVGTRFDLIECDCINGEGEDETFMADLPPFEEEPEEIHAWLYFPFDENLNDYSNHRLWVTPVVFGGAWVDQRIRVYGEGSARISSSGIAVPGLSGADFRDHLSLGMWIKCYSASTLCHGDLFANGNAKALPTIRMGLREMEASAKSAKNIAIELSLQVASVDEPVNLIYQLPRPSSLASWTHFGMRYDGYALSLFINGTLINEIPATGNIGVSMTQIVVAGTVVNPHQFRGYVDEVIVLPVALDDAGMKGLLKADMARLAHDGWIKV